MRTLLPFLLLPACLDARHGSTFEADTTPAAEVAQETADTVEVVPEVAAPCSIVSFQSLTLDERPDSLGFEVAIELTAGSNGPSPIVDYQWALTQQPFGGEDELHVLELFDERQFFTATNPGTYEFTVEGIDSNGARSCNTAVQIVEVPPPTRGLFVEVLWSAPDSASPDVAPGAGSDLDLHFVHPSARDAFDTKWAAFWYNANPDWGEVANTRDNPFLTDDFTAPGRETVYLREPDPTTMYCVDVHHWGGPDGVGVQVRYYGDGTLFAEATHPRLDHYDLFHAPCFAWTGDLDTLTGEVRGNVTPDVDPLHF